MNNEPIKHDKAFLPSVSASGDNAYYLKGCDTVQRSPAYASCLFKIDEFEAGRSHESHRDCHEAIRIRTCKALGMREEEQLKGVALFYFPRKPPQALIVSVAAAGEFGVRISNLTPPQWIPKDSAQKGRFGNINKSVLTNKEPVNKTALDRELEQTDQGYATAINAAVAELSAPDVVTPPIRTAKLTMKPGESPLEYARRVAASRNQSKER